MLQNGCSSPNGNKQTKKVIPSLYQMLLPYIADKIVGFVKTTKLISDEGNAVDNTLNVKYNIRHPHHVACKSHILPSLYILGQHCSRIFYPNQKRCQSR